MTTGRFHLSPQRRELLESLLRAEGIDRRPATTVPRRPDPSAPAPLAFSQSRFWFWDRFSGNGASYVISAGLRIHGACDLAAFAAACEEIVRRHEALRTVFRDGPDGPVQEVRATLPPEIRTVALRGLAADAVDEEIARREAALIARPFDLADGPLFRVELLDLADDSAAVLVTLHHIVCDRWSMGVLMRELIALYGARTRGTDPRLPELDVQYADFAQWQNGDDAQAAWDADTDHWLRTLKGAPAEIGLPTPLPRPREKTYRGSSVPLALPAPLTAAVREVARAAGATPFMVVTAAFQAVLARLCDHDDIVVGTPVAGRTQVELEPLVGLFVNTLALRCDLSGDPTFRETVRRVSAVCLDAYDHQSVPFERLVEQLQPERSLAHTPVFQVMVSYQNVPFPTWNEGGLRVEPLELTGHKAEFDLLLDLFEDGDTVRGRLEYSTDLYDEESARALTDLFVRTLTAATADPDIRLGALPPATAAPLPAAARPAEPPQATAHEATAAAAAASPDAAAVRDADGPRLTHAAADRRANQLAHRLLRNGAGPGVLVGLALPPSADLAVAVPAVLKSGAAYVPLDGGDRVDTAALVRRLDDAQVPLLLTHRALADRLPATDTEIWCLDELAAALDGESGDAPATTVTGDDLACVAHTAGTTGRPEPVRITHTALRARLAALQDSHPLTPADRVLHTGPVTYDTTVRDILRPLAAGAAVVPVADASPAALRAHGITTLHTTPRRLAALLDAPGLAGCTTLRSVLTSGEVLPRALQERFFAGCAAELHHLYATTETGELTTRPCHPGAPEATAPLGRPLPHARLHLRDHAGRPVPDGVPGELYVSGACLADGYLDRPGPTAERFAPDPHDAATVLHRTGDLVRVRPDGTLEFTGRTADRLTVRGFRHDAAPVEAALRDHPQLADVFLLARPDATGARRPVAYVTPAGEAAPDPAELAAHARAHLPEYLAPAAFVVLDALPLTDAGTVDRGALPGPDEESDAPRAFEAPRTPLEEAVAATWRGLLGVARIGAHDDFFDLGGHSLLITKLASQLSAAHGVHIPLRDLFEHPTVAGMAAQLTAHASGPAADPIPAADRLAPLPVSFAQEELCLHQPVPAEEPFHNVLTAVHLTGDLDEAALRTALDTVVRRHEPLRSRITGHATAPRQTFEPDGGWPMTTVDLRAKDEPTRTAELRALVTAEERRPFRLAAEPPVRGFLVRLTDRETALIQVMHHLVTDNWSYGVLFHEMRELYAAAVQGRPADLPEITVPFGDFAAWQQGRLADGGLDAHLDHWRTALAGLPPTLCFTAPDHQAHTAATGATRGFTVDAATATALAEIGRARGATLFMVLLAAFDVLLAAYSGSDDIPVDFPLAGRERPETEHLIGYFVNHLVVRSDLSGDPAFGALVDQVRERTLAAYTHQSAPLWALDGVIPEGHSPSGISFNLLNADVPSRDLHGLTAAPLDLGVGDDYVFSEVVVNFEASAVDLALIVREDDDGALRGMWLYALERLDARAVAAMMRAWPELLAAVAADPDRSTTSLTTALRGARQPADTDDQPKDRA
ncbi:MULTISPECIES: condensation domain-containing protein [Streptomyces]|uniref:Condensation domain-containing protein n=1 Tax=Streptomyces ramulosus TaxID=47762 RepID=A0ABW1FAA7_9ACTN